MAFSTNTINFYLYIESNILYISKFTINKISVRTHSSKYAARLSGRTPFSRLQFGMESEGIRNSVVVLQDHVHESLKGVALLDVVTGSSYWIYLRQTNICVDRLVMKVGFMFVTSASKWTKIIYLWNKKIVFKLILGGI